MLPLAGRAALTLGVCLAGSGCGARSLDESTAAPPSGDAATAWPPVVVQAGYFLAEGSPITLVSDGDPVAVRFASQGGYAMFVGARVRGLDPGPVRIATELVNPEDGEALVSDARDVRFVPSLAEAGAVEPDSESSADFSHLVPCPNYGARPVHGIPWALRVQVSDPEAAQRSGAISVSVIPTCSAGSRYAQCLCQCQPDYVLGKCGAEH